MAHYAFSTVEYSLTEDRLEVSDTPIDTCPIQGQADFLGLVLSLDVAVLGKSRNTVSLREPETCGTGASSSVARFEAGLRLSPEQDFVNSLYDDWFNFLPLSTDGKFNLVYVVKQLRTHSGYTDAQHLMSIASEVRALSKRSLREHRNIITLFCVSWQERPDQGRYWPQLLVEAADLGTLDAYLNTRKIDLQDKWCLLSEIALGLHALHTNGIIHCDIKPANVLIFVDARYSENDENARNPRNRVAVTPKLCDFGCALHNDDYSSTGMITVRVGTFPWMAPEVENAVPLAFEYLPALDVYSYGLLFASVMMDGHVPFEGRSRQDVKAIKLETEQGLAASQAVTDEVAATVELPATIQRHVAQMIAATVNIIPGARLNTTSLLRGLLDGLPRSPLHSPVEALATATSAMRTASLEERSQRNDVNRTLNEPISTDVRWDQTEVRMLELVESLEVALSISNEATNSDRDNAHGSFNDSYFDDRPAGNARTGLSGQREKGLTLLDLCLQTQYNPGLLPRAAAQEVTADLHTKHDAQGSGSADASFALACAYFNGSIVERDTLRGLQYHVQGAAAGHRDACVTLTNLLESCGQRRPQLTEKVHADLFGGYDPLYAIFEEVSDFFTPLLRLEPRMNQVLVSTWMKHCPDDYKKTLASVNMLAGYEVMLNTFNRVAKSTQRRCPEIDVRTLPSCTGPRDYCFLSSLDQATFTQDLALNECLDYAQPETGLTFLQRAVLHNDEDMIWFLVFDKGAQLENFGNTPGWTPLWLACFTGQFSTARLLLTLGASTECCDQKTGFTIIHLLNHFSDARACGFIICRCIAQMGVAFNPDVPAGDGLTPLHATFIGWDFSRGAAARALLEHGASPLAENVRGGFDWTPLALCTLRMQDEVLGSMLRSPYIARQDDREHLIQLRKSKTSAAKALMQVSEFAMRAMVGKGWRNRLRTVLHLLVETDAFQELLILFVDKCKHDAAAILLDMAFDDPRVDHLGVELLQRAIERRVDTLVMTLVHRGADLFAAGVNDGNALHIAADHNPKLLPWLLYRALKTPADSGGRHRSAEEVLATRDADGFHVLAKLLIGGTEKEHRLLDHICRQHDIQLDTLGAEDGEDGMTLTAKLIFICLRDALVPLSQLEYMLAPDAPPRYVYSSNGETLLTLAVMGVESYDPTLNNTGHAICKMLLDRYPDPRHLASTPHQKGAIHRAALWNNIVAIDMMFEHLARQCRRDASLGGARALFAQMANALEQGCTALDMAAQVLFGGFSTVFSAERVERRRQAAGPCYNRIRELGGLHAFEMGQE